MANGLQISNNEKGEWLVGDQNFGKGADAASKALKYLQGVQAEEIAAKNRPVNIKSKTSEKNIKSMVVYYGDQTENGRYPAFTVVGTQFHAIVAAWPEIVKEYNRLAAAGEISQTFREHKPAQPVKVG
jgi:hypothetical protein